MLPPSYPFDYSPSFRQASRIEVPVEAAIESDDEDWCMFGYAADSEDDEPLWV